MAGITDTVAVGTLCEHLGLDAPIVAAPNVNPPLGRHPTFRASLHRLREWGVRVLFDESAPREARMPPWEEILEEVNRAHEAAGCHHEGVRGQAPRRGPRKQRRDRARGLHVGERIAIYRRRRGLSQPALANLIGRSEAWLSQVERGIRHADRLSVIIRLAQVLRVTVEDLIGQPLSLAPNGGAEYRAIPTLRAALTDYEVIPAAFGIAMRDGPVRELPSLQHNVDQANRLYQAAHYATRRR